MGDFIIRIALSLCIIATTSRGQKGCNCRCSVPHYGELDVCTWLYHNSPKVDSNRNEIDYLKKENSELLNFKNYYERKMNEVVLPYIETSSQQSTFQHAPGNLHKNINEQVPNDISVEIEMLKSKFEAERNQLEAKIEQIEKNCLSATDNLLAMLNAIEIRVVQAENVVLQTINKTEKQALEMKEEILVQLTKNEDQTLKVKEEILEKINGTENQIFSLSNDLYSKIKDMEVENIKLKHEFSVHENEQTNKSASVKHELLVKVNHLESETLKNKQEILDQVNKTGNQISNVSNDLYSKIQDMEAETLKLKDELVFQANEQKNQTVSLKQGFLIKVGELRNETFKFKEDIIEEVNKTGNQISNVSNDLYSKIQDMEAETLKLKDELIVQANEQKNQTASLKHEFLVKVSDLRNETFKFKEDIIEEVNKTGNQISSVSNNLYSKIKDMEAEILKLKDELLVQANDQRNQTASVKHELLAKVSDLGKKTSKSKKDILEKVDETGNQILNLSNYLYSKIQDMEAETLKLKHEQKNQTESAKHEFLLKLNYLEMEISNVKDDSLQIATDLGKQMSNEKDEVLMRMNDTVNFRDLKLKEEFSVKVNEVEEHLVKQRMELEAAVDQVKHLLRKEVEEQRERWINFEDRLNDTRLKVELITPELQSKINSSAENLTAYIYERHLRKIYQRLRGVELEKYRTLDRRLVALERRMVNVTDTLIINQLTFDAFKQNISSTVHYLQAKSDEMEMVVKELDPKDIATNLTVIWFNIAEMWNNVVSISSNISKIWNNITEIHTFDTNSTKNIVMVWKSLENIRETQEKSFHLLNDSVTQLQGIIDDMQIHSVVEKETQYSGSVFNGTWSAIQEQQMCGNVLLTKDIIMLNESIHFLYDNPGGDKTIEQILLVVRKKPAGSAHYNKTCIAVVISDHWLITSYPCIKDHTASYQYGAWFSVLVPLWSEVKPFLSSLEQYPTLLPSRIGLLHSEKSIEEMAFYDFRNLTVACVPPYKIKDKVFGSAAFVGWDTVRYFSLHLYDVKLISDDECKKSYPALSSSMICTKYDEAVKKACKATEGGLLFKEIENRAVLIGIVQHCGWGDMPVIYNEIAYFANWIDSFTQNQQNQN